MRSKVIALTLALLFACMSAAQAGEQVVPMNKLLTKSEIEAKRSLIIIGAVNGSLRQKVEWCRHQVDTDSQRACQVAHDWLHKIGEVMVAQLDMMEVVVDLPDSSPLKAWLAQMMSVERLNAELAMAAYRSNIIAMKFSPQSKQP